MTIPSAMFIDAAFEMLDDLTNEQIARHLHEIRVSMDLSGQPQIRARIESKTAQAPALTPPPTNFEAGYLIGLTTARALLAGGLRDL